LIDIALGYAAAKPITQFLAAVAESAATIVQEYLIGLAIPVDYEGVQIAQSHARALGADQVLVAVAKLPRALIQPNLVAGALGEEDVEGFIAVQIPQDRTCAGFETLVAQGKVCHTVVQP
jgi:hypothetical protein